MRIRLLLLTAFAAWVAGAAHAWPTIPLRCDATRAAPPAPTLDQLIDRLAEVRAKEAALQSQRADLERQLRDRLAEQAQRLQQVGMSPAAGAAPILPPFHGVDIDRPILRINGQVPDNIGFPPDAAPPPTTRRTFTPGSVEIDPFAYWKQEPGWTETGALADRFDALGGLPTAYTRWWRDTAPRPRRGPAPEPLFHGGGLFF